MGEIYDFLESQPGKALGILAISTVGGLLFKYVHNSVLHPLFGAGRPGPIALVSLGIGATGVLGYYIWVALSEIDFSPGIAAISFASSAGVHYADHTISGLGAVEAVGGTMFVLGFTGTFVNYYLRESGVEGPYLD